MDVRRRVSFGYADAWVREELRSLRIEQWSDDYVVFEISEEDPRWCLIQAWHAQRFSVPPPAYTTFTAEELSSAEWLEFAADWRNGYPMPENDLGYLNLTYDLDEYCAECGLGARQKGPFRLLDEPEWGTRSIMGINWVSDVVFVKRDVARAVFAPLGIGCQPVLAYKKETELTTVVQLSIDTILDAELDVRDHPFEICSYCRRRKYLPFTRGMFPPMTKLVEGIHAVLSAECFGSGASANRAILVSQTFYGAIRRHHLESVHFHVVAPMKPQ